MSDDFVSMTSIVRDYLLKHGFDGLCDDEGCSCDINNLFNDCEWGIGHCYPAYHWTDCTGCKFAFFDGERCSSLGDADCWFERQPSRREER